jgi:hypothetical protein
VYEKGKIVASASNVRKGKVIFPGWKLISVFKRNGLHIERQDSNR